MPPGDEEMRRGENAEDGLFVASLAKGMLVLESFDGGAARLSLSEIAARTDIGKSAAQRAVATLHALGFLHKDLETRTYRLSPKLLHLTRHYSAESLLLEAGLPEMNLCYELLEETVNITERDGTEITCIARIPGRHPVTISIGVGWRAPAYASAPGLAMLAFEPEEVARRILQKSEIVALTRRTVTDIPELMAWLKQIRKDGFVTGDQLMNDGEYSIAAPILGPRGEVVGALNVSIPTSRVVSHTLRSKVIPTVMETAARISSGIST